MTERTGHAAAPGSTTPGAAPGTGHGQDTLVCVALLHDVGPRRVGDRMLVTATDARRLAADGVVEVLDDET